MSSIANNIDTEKCLIDLVELPMILTFSGGVQVKSRLVSYKRKLDEFCLQSECEKLDICVTSKTVRRSKINYQIMNLLIFFNLSQSRCVGKPSSRELKDRIVQGQRRKQRMGGRSTSCHTMNKKKTASIVMSSKQLSVDQQDSIDPLGIPDTMGFHTHIHAIFSGTWQRDWMQSRSLESPPQCCRHVGGGYLPLTDKHKTSHISPYTQSKRYKLLGKEQRIPFFFLGKEQKKNPSTSRGRTRRSFKLKILYWRSPTERGARNSSAQDPAQTQGKVDCHREEKRQH